MLSHKFTITVEVADLHLLDLDLVECKKENLLWSKIYDTIVKKNMYKSVAFEDIIIYDVKLEIINVDKDKQLLDINVYVEYDLISPLG